MCYFKLLFYLSIGTNLIIYLIINFHHTQEIIGSVLEITLEDDVTNDNTGCSAYIDVAYDLPVLGPSSLCTLSGKVITINVASELTNINFPQKIVVKADGWKDTTYDVKIYPADEATLLTLPTLDLSVSGSITSGSVLAQDNFPFTINNVITCPHGSPTWTYTWADCTSSDTDYTCPIDVTSSITLSLPSKPADYSYTPFIKQTSVFNLSETYSFNFRIKFGSVEQKANRLKVITLNNYNFDFTDLTCDKIFASAELLKLGTESKCIHDNGADYIYIYLDVDNTLSAGDTLELKNLAYFVTFSIIIPTNPVTFTASSIGSIRKITFSDVTLTTVNGNTACGDLISADSLTDLGSSPSCSFGAGVLSINYGKVVTASTPTISLLLENMCIIANLNTRTIHDQHYICNLSDSTAINCLSKHILP